MLERFGAKSREAEPDSGRGVSQAAGDYQLTVQVVDESGSQITARLSPWNQVAAPKTTFFGSPGGGFTNREGLATATGLDGTIFSRLTIAPRPHFRESGHGLVGVTRGQFWTPARIE